MTDSYDVLSRLEDLQSQSQHRYMHTESGFLNEEEQAAALRRFSESPLIRYDGGYPGALKKKVIFLRDEEDDFSDIACIISGIDQRFRTISHRDVLGSLMALQIDRHSFGDFWIEKERIVLYTSHQMAAFLCENLIRISSLSVHFEISEEHPIQIFHTRQFETVVSSERMDVLVAGLASVSRSKAVQMIREGKVQLNHRPLVKPDEVCDNNSTISIRGSGRYHYLGIVRHTRRDRIVVRFSQDIQEGERIR